MHCHNGARRDVKTSQFTAERDSIGIEHDDTISYIVEFPASSRYIVPWSAVGLVHADCVDTVLPVLFQHERLHQEIRVVLGIDQPEPGQKVVDCILFELRPLAGREAEDTGQFGVESRLRVIGNRYQIIDFTGSHGDDDTRELIGHDDAPFVQSIAITAIGMSCSDDPRQRGRENEQRSKTDCRYDTRGQYQVLHQKSPHAMFIETAGTVGEARPHGCVLAGMQPVLASNALSLTPPQSTQR